MKKLHLKEWTVRQMRNSVYEIPSSDANWEGCKYNWMTQDSSQWLVKYLVLKYGSWFDQESQRIFTSEDLK